MLPFYIPFITKKINKIDSFINFYNIKQTISNMSTKNIVKVSNAMSATPAPAKAMSWAAIAAIPKKEIKEEKKEEVQEEYDEEQAKEERQDAIHQARVRGMNARASVFIPRQQNFVEDN